MKKFRLFFAIILLAMLTLSSCTKEESTSTENKEVLNEINDEVDKTANEEKNESAETEKTENVSWTTVTTESKPIETASSWKVQKINKIYKSPGWNDEVAFSIELDWDKKIKKVLVETVKWWDTSTQLMKLFADSINKEVVWKTITEAGGVVAVWWASLTTNAFKDALKEVK